MSKTKTEWISNWLLNTEACPKQSSNSTKSSRTTMSSDNSKNQGINKACAKKRPKQQKPQINKRIRGIIKSDKNELTVSPVSGTFILKDWNTDAQEVSIDPRKNSKKSENFTRSEVLLNSVASSYVHVSEETRRELEKIPNLIGPYECKLCKTIFDDAFELAMHNCPRVVHVEYKCSECKKTFNCPANLASHKRWHRPKINAKPIPKSFEEDDNLEIMTEMVVNKTSANEYSDLQSTKSTKFFENLPQIIEKRNSYDSQQEIQQQQTNTYDTQLNVNNELFRTMYRNYFVAAATAFAQNLIQTSQPSPSTIPSSSSPIQYFNNDHRNEYGFCQNNYVTTTNVNQNFTCKFCFTNFKDNFNLIYHMKKFHSSTLLHF